MKTLTIFIFGIFFWGVLLPSCKHEPELIPGTAEVCFNSDVMTIINSNCTVDACHNGGGEGPQLTTYDDIYRLVTPGKPMESKLYKVVTKNPNSLNIMPPKPKQALNNTQLDLISLWILQGAKNDTTCVSAQ